MHKKQDKDQKRRQDKAHGESKYSEGNKQKDNKEGELEQKIIELTDTLQRVQAEFDNFRSRMQKENQEFLRCANKNLLEKMIPILDTIDLALKNSADKDEFIKGAELIFTQIKDLATCEGLEEIEAQGKRFDPSLHHALITEEAEEEGIVLEVLQKGYTLGGKVLKHAKVKVSRKADKGNQDKKEKPEDDNKEDS